MPIWKHSTAYGGNKWAGISLKIRDLVSAMEAGHALTVEALYRDALGMSHDTGLVADKVQRLEVLIAIVWAIHR